MKNRRCVFVVFVAVALLFPARVAWSEITVRGDRVLIETDLGRLVIERGVIVRLKNKLTDETYTAEPQPAELTGLLWRTDPKRVGAKTEVVAVRKGPDRARISATFADHSTLVTTIEIEPETQDVLIRQQGSSKRKGLYGVQWGIAGLDVRQTDCLVPGYSGVKLGKATPTREHVFGWPGGWEAQMMVIQGRQGGCWVWCRDAQMRFKELRWKRRRDRVELTFGSSNFAPFDESTSVRSVTWRLAFFKGDWRVPAERYRRWAKQAFGLTSLADRQPAWVGDIRFVVIMGMQREILDALRKQVAPSATLLYVPDWRRDGYDRNYPDYTAKENFKPFVDYAHKLGYRVMPHMNYFGCDPKNEAYQRLKAWQMRSPFTKELLWWIPPRDRNRTDVEPTNKFAYINPASKAWRDELTRRLVEAQKRYGFDAIHLDQSLGIFNDAGGRIDGLTCAEGNVALHRQLREAMPRVALSGEGVNEVTCRYEAFAQRHAALAVNHVHRTWNDDFIACGHPISSYFLTPYTKLYGYLGMSNPDDRELFLAWRRAYANWGILPTFARPRLSQLKHPGSEVRSLLAEARVWVDARLTPDFSGSWPASIQCRLRGPNGETAVYERDEANGSRFVQGTGEQRRTVYATIMGRNSVAGPGSISGWLAFNKQRLFGLDPKAVYTWLDEPRNNRVPHVLKAPDHVVVHVPVLNEKKMRIELERLGSRKPYDFIKQMEAAETGMVVAGKESPLDAGASFEPADQQCGFVLKRSFFAHPPWRLDTSQGDAPPATFGRYHVALPSDETAVLEFAIGLRDGVNGRSDGAEFLVKIDDEIVFDEVWAQSRWKEVRIPLNRWAGRRVTVAFLTTIGPKRSARFDWACWGEPRIRFAPPPKEMEITVASPKPVREVVGADPRMRWTKAGTMQALDVYKARLTVPGRIILLWDTPRPITLPLSLADARFDVSVSVEKAPATLPIRNVGASRGAGRSKGIQRSGLNIHPPDRGRTSVDYLLQLPDRDPIVLEFGVGLRDGSQSQGVIFLVEANGKEVYRTRLTKPDGWHPARIDLSAFAGKALLLSLVVDADGSYTYDWATWADPMLK